MDFVSTDFVSSQASFAQSDLVAIDVLLEPDETMVAAANHWNARLLEQTPDGFELDSTHLPHITLLQSFVAKNDLDTVLRAVGETADNLNIAGLQMEATGLYHIPSGELGLQGIVIKPSPQLLAVQEAIIAAVGPFSKTGGNQFAFVPDPTGTTFDPYLFEYVETFIQNQSGVNYNPHVTTGVGPLAWVADREAEPFEPFTFGAKDIAVYSLGNFGAAVERLVPTADT